MADALRRPDGVIPQMPIIHASNLFPEYSDEVRLRFLENMVSLAAEFNLRIYRIGYFQNSDILSMTVKNTGIVGVCFASLLMLLKEELVSNEIWPVMEIEHTSEQDSSFAGLIQNIDYFSSQIDQNNLTINNSNLGELHYMTKRSMYGGLTDCISYLLYAKFLDDRGLARGYKKELARIAQGLKSVIVFNEIIEMKFQEPPAGYVGEGPIRFAVPFVPT